MNFISTIKLTCKHKIKHKLQLISKQIEYKFLPNLPYNTIIDIRYLSMYKSKYVKIYTPNRIYKTKHELWDILSYIIEWILLLETYSTCNLLYIDNNDDWIHKLINIIQLKYYKN